MCTCCIGVDERESTEARKKTPKAAAAPKVVAEVVRGKVNKGSGSTMWGAQPATLAGDKHRHGNDDFAGAKPTKKTMHVRPTLKVFKDSAKDDVGRYAGTSMRS